MQDFCVADPASPAKVNGLACKDPKSTSAEDFYFSGLHLAGNTSNTFGSKVTPVNVAEIPGMRGLLVSHWSALTMHHGELTLHTLIQELLKYSQSLKVLFKLVSYLQIQNSRLKTHPVSSPYTLPPQTPLFGNTLGMFFVVVANHKAHFTQHYQYESTNKNIIS
ncbi:putative germin-like protein 2-1 [Capsicum annuum]|uniref:Germin-like protein 2-1 n=1 Tax=Capsicum annuum TaxID=4072 RepID=A0A2G2Y0V9_CAPAN|nr:putative germin-like protein 2-1 [Capsicum annuum]